VNSRNGDIGGFAAAALSGQPHQRHQRCGDIRGNGHLGLQLVEHETLLGREQGPLRAFGPLGEARKYEVKS
jgi:hypothetical protein